MKRHCARRRPGGASPAVAVQDRPQNTRNSLLASVRRRSGTGPRFALGVSCKTPPVLARKAEPGASNSSNHTKAKGSAFSRVGTLGTKTCGPGRGVHLARKRTQGADQVSNSLRGPRPRPAQAADRGGAVLPVLDAAHSNSVPQGFSLLAGYMEPIPSEAGERVEPGSAASRSREANGRPASNPLSRLGELRAPSLRTEARTGGPETPLIGDDPRRESFRGEFS